jgi:hypothetical protein
VAPYSLLEFRVFTLKKYKANFWRGESYWDSSTVKHRGVYHWGESEVWAITTSKTLRTSWEWHKLKLLWQKWTTESPPCRTIMKKPGVYRVFKRSTQKIHCTSYIWSFSSFLHCKNGPSAQTVPILCHILSFRTTRGWSEHVRWPLTHFLSSAFSPSKNTRQIFGGVNPTEILAQWSTGGVYHWGESEVWAITTSKTLRTSWEWHKLKLLWQKWTDGVASLPNYYEKTRSIPSFQAFYTENSLYFLYMKFFVLFALQKMVPAPKQCPYYAIFYLLEPPEAGRST